MSEERITTVESNDPAQPRTTHTTIVRDDEPRRSGGSGWVIAIVLILAVIAGIYFFSQASDSEVAKDNAIAGAANEVGEAASSVGDAVDSAADKLNTE